MKKNKRYVFDTNTLISSFFFEESKPNLALKKGFSEGEVLISLETVLELSNILFRKKFDKYSSINKRNNTICDFVMAAKFIQANIQVAGCRDLKDNKFLSLAVSGFANAIITGDEDLLVLNPFRGIGIISADEFLKNF